MSETVFNLSTKHPKNEVSPHLLTETAAVKHGKWTPTVKIDEKKWNNTLSSTGIPDLPDVDTKESKHIHFETIESRLLAPTSASIHGRKTPKDPSECSETPEEKGWNKSIVTSILSKDDNELEAVVKSKKYENVGSKLHSATTASIQARVRRLSLDGADTASLPSVRSLDPNPTLVSRLVLPTAASVSGRYKKPVVEEPSYATEWDNRTKFVEMDIPLPPSPRKENTRASFTTQSHHRSSKSKKGNTTTSTSETPPPSPFAGNGNSTVDAAVETPNKLVNAKDFLQLKRNVASPSVMRDTVSSSQKKSPRAATSPTSPLDASATSPRPASRPGSPRASNPTSPSKALSPGTNSNIVSPEKPSTPLATPTPSVVTPAKTEPTQQPTNVPRSIDAPPATTTPTIAPSPQPVTPFPTQPLQQPQAQEVPETARTIDDDDYSIVSEAVASSKGKAVVSQQ